MTGPATLAAALDRFARVPLIDQPTPIQRLHGLEKALGEAGGGVRLFVKRDDLPFLGGGGSKLRKLEYLMGAARAEGCDSFVTTGGIQSNHARLSAAVAAKLGFACELVLARLVPREDEEYRLGGNRLLDDLFGARVHELPGDADTLAFARERGAALGREGRKAYVVGAGGSSPVGCLGYAYCAQEIAAQEATAGLDFARVIVPNGSFGTHAGLAAGFAAMGQDPARLLSFAVLETAEAARPKTHALAAETLARLDPVRSISADAIAIDGSQRGTGYGIPTDAMLEAVRLMARSEGLLLDPVYSGKAFAGLLALVRGGAFAPGAAVLFVMTGGSPGLFAYRSALES